MKILTYDDYLNSSLEEIDTEVDNSFTYNENESRNLMSFMDKFSKEIGIYEDIIKQFDPAFISVNRKEKCKDTLKRYQEKARDF